MKISYENHSSYIGSFNYLKGEGIIIDNQINIKYYLVDYGSKIKKELSEDQKKSRSLNYYINEMNDKFSDYAIKNQLSIKLN